MMGIITRVHLNSDGVYTVEKMHITESGVYQFALFNEDGTEMYTTGSVKTRDTERVAYDC
jgi:hypothetical protein